MFRMQSTGRKGRNITLLILLLGYAVTFPAGAQQSCSAVKMRAERLPDLNIPRLGHTVFCAGEEVVAAGGHTTGFVPTPTAEYFRDGTWHLMQMTYPHDQGVSALTATGEVLVAGGHGEALGIGQTFPLELYDTAAHSFRGYGCLASKRCFAGALPLDSGRVVISGNWYADDGIEVYDGSRQCRTVKPVAQHRSYPYILRTAGDNAIVFSARDNHAADFDTIIIDRLKGEPFTVPLFGTWRPISPLSSCQAAGFIGDEAKGDYTNLIPVQRGDSLVAIARAVREDFSLLPTEAPIPMRSQWGRICWYAPVIADRKQGRAYIAGYGEDSPSAAGDHRFYVAAIDYRSEPAPITLYYSEPVDSAGRYQAVLTDSGDLMVAGGILQHNNNYEPSSTVYLLHVGPELSGTQAGCQPRWLWTVLALLLLAALAVTGIRLQRRRQAASQPKAGSNAVSDEALMERICRYMEEQRPYLNSELKAQDVADALGTNRTYVSNCVRSCRGCSFSQFVNAYRIEYAQQLMNRYPDKKISAVSVVSGFTTEVSFFRTFKAVTGMTPKDWMASRKARNYFSSPLAPTVKASADEPLTD